MDDNGIKGIISSKVGGIPVWGIAIVALGGMVWYLNKGTTTTPSSDTVSSDTSSDITSDTAPISTTGDSTIASSTSEVTQTSTNADWQKSAMQLIVPLGLDRSVVESGIAKYLAGDGLTWDENTAINAIITKIGPPPEGTGGVSAVAKNNAAAKRQGTPPVQHTVKSSNEDSYAKLAQLYWGRSDTAAINQLREDNPSYSTATGFDIGTVIHVGKYRNPSYYVTTSKVRTLAAVAAHNGLTQPQIMALNPTLKYGVNLKIGEKVQVR